MLIHTKSSRTKNIGKRGKMELSTAEVHITHTVIVFP